MSRARAAKLIVDDLDDPARILKKGSLVRAGQRLRAHRPPPDPDVEVPIPDIVYRDADLLIINKPSGLATHPTATRFRATVTHWLRTRGLGEEPVHRLDVETSGVLVCARNPETNRALKAIFAERQATKTYLAVVAGNPPDAWTNSTSLGFATNSAVRLRMGRGLMPAKTSFRTLERSENRALVEAQPLTGRQHQIRVHLSFAGTPIVGDKLYGPDEALFLSSLERPLTDAENARLGHNRLALHAERIEFEWGGHRRTFVADFPNELRVLL